MVFTHLALPIITIVCATVTIALIITHGTTADPNVLASLSTVTCVLSLITAHNALRQVRD